MAVFVKTAGLSPVKTRLGKSLGVQAAERFHELSAASVASVLALAAERSAGAVQPYFAVAEAEGESRWRDFPTLPQGDGELGERLARVYDLLLVDGDQGGRGAVAPVLIGADAPQITEHCFREVAEAFAQGAAFVLGPATDGGFYLMAGRLPVPEALWRSVPYSAADTGKRLAEALAALGPVHLLAPVTDVDAVDDLPPVTAALAALAEPTAAQRRLHAWLADR